MSVITGGTIIEGGPPQQLSGSAAPVDGTDEVQILTITADSGTFKVGYDGWYTTAIAYGATSATLQTAMRLLAPINGANVTVTGDAPHTITFVTALGKTDVPLCTTDVTALFNSSPTAGTAVVTQSVAGVTATGRGAPAGTRYTRTATGVNYTNTGTAAAPTWTTVSDSLGTSYLGSVTPGTVAASKALVVDSNKLLNELNVTGAVAIVGDTTATGVVTQSKTTSTANAGTVRGVHGQVTASHAAITAGSIAGLRGLATLSGIVSGGALYAYGAQGKLVVTGTMNHADARLCAVLAQLDISAGVYTAGQISALWVDAGATSVAGALGGQFDMVRITNTTVSVPNSVIYAYSEGSFLLDLDGPGGNADWYTAGATGGATRSHKLKVKVGGVTGYISVYTD